MIAILPVSLLADDTGAAMLHSNGNVLVNKNSAPASAAIFRDTLIETQKDAAARIELSGSSADISAETVIEFEGDELVLDHGTVSVNTSHSLRVRVGCITVTPVNADWTHYEVTDLDGKVTVSALKNDTYIDSQSKNPQQAKQSPRSEHAIVREGERKSREEKCGAASLRESDQFGARGAIMNSPWVRWPAVVGVGAIACLGLCHDDDPISPAKPSK